MPIERVFVVHGEPGWDEPTPCGPFELYDVSPGRVERTERDPHDFGLARCTPQSLAGGDAAHNAAAMRAVFAGADRGPHRDALVLNAALALEVTGTVPDAAAAIRAAGDAIDRGDAAAPARQARAFRRVAQGTGLMGLLSDMAASSAERVRAARRVVGDAQLRALAGKAPSAARAGAGAARLRRHRRTEAAFAVAREISRRRRWIPVARLRGLCGRWRRGLLHPHRARAIRWRPGAPAASRRTRLRHSAYRRCARISWSIPTRCSRRACTAPPASC